MRVSELINKLNMFDPDLQVIIGIDRSAGFPDDNIETYNIERVFKRNNKEIDQTPLCGDFDTQPDFDENKDLVVVYSFP